MGCMTYHCDTCDEMYGTGVCPTCGEINTEPFYDEEIPDYTEEREDEK